MRHVAHMNVSRRTYECGIHQRVRPPTQESHTKESGHIHTRVTESCHKLWWRSTSNKLLVSRTWKKECQKLPWRSRSKSHSLLLIHSLYGVVSHTWKSPVTYGGAAAREVIRCFSFTLSLSRFTHMKSHVTICGGRAGREVIDCYSFFFFRAMNESRCTKHAAVLYNSKWAELDFTTGNRAQESYLQCSELQCGVHVVQCGVHVVQCGVHVVQCGAVHALVDSIELQFNWIGFYYRESSTRRYWATSTCSATVMCHTTHSGVWHDSFAWLICICNMTHLCVRRDWNLRAIKLFHVSDDRAHVCVRHEWFMCAAWLVCTISTRSAQ